MKWMIAMNALIAVVVGCCIASSVEARERFTTKTVQRGYAVHAVNSPYVQVASVPEPATFETTVNSVTRTRTRESNICSCGCNKVGCNCSQKVSSVAASLSGTGFMKSNSLEYVANRYRGPRAEVAGMTTRQHLIEHHGYTPQQLNGFARWQLDNIHSAAHNPGQ